MNPEEVVVVVVNSGRTAAQGVHKASLQGGVVEQWQNAMWFTVAVTTLTQQRWRRDDTKKYLSLSSVSFDIYTYSSPEICDPDYIYIRGWCHYTLGRAGTTSHPPYITDDDDDGFSYLNFRNRFFPVSNRLIWKESYNIL